METKNNDLTCKRCGAEVKYKKELLDGVCFNCFREVEKQVTEAGIEGWDFWLWQLKVRNWLKKSLQAGKTREKYAGQKVYVPASFIRQLKAI